MSPKLPKRPALSPEEAQAGAERIVAHMLEKDGFSRWLGISVTVIAPAKSTCTLTVRPEMLNGFGVCHGGVTFALADSAFAFASNTQGNVAMSIDNQISYPAPARLGDVLTATAREESGSDRLAFYRVEVHNQLGALIAMFKGTVYKTRTPHLPEDGA